MCTQSGTLLEMRIETLSVREAREQLPSVLARFRDGDRTPVGVGSHRKMEAIIVPVNVFDDLIAIRTRALASARGSLRAEGLDVDPEVDAIAAQWATGQISAAEMRARVRRLYGLR